jgi:cellulose biosynthesis protein BcsQ
MEFTFSVATLAAIIFPIIAATFALGWAMRAVQNFLLRQNIKSLTDRVVVLQSEAQGHLWEISQIQKQVREFQTAPPSEESDLGTFNLIRNAVLGSNDSLWTVHADKLDEVRPKRPAKAPTIVSVTNLKGGVGKTTVTINFGAFLNSVKKARILFVDADYQGSLTNNLINAAKIDNPTPQTAPWLRFDSTPEEILSTSIDIGKALPGCSLIGASYRLSEDENRSFVQWLIGESTDDVRFRLARFLWSPKIAENFDYVLIDAPPRLGTAGVNALCASSHFVVPTLMTQTSSEPIDQMLQMFKHTFKDLNADLRLAGVVANQTYRSDLIARERAIIDNINQTLSTYSNSRVFNRNIRMIASILKEAGTAIPYQNHKDVRVAFDQLGEEILDSIHK